ncbi:hypothetical protein ACTD5D_21280 [Nocardia takedensis]|uniref:hypothetical protein n=1 Tax=Nocardia takedensis TaxID=259390 RepID=UPI003F760E46
MAVAVATCAHGDRAPSPDASTVEVPTIDLLNSKLSTLMDPRVGVAEKKGIVAGGAQPQLSDPRVAEAGGLRFVYRVIEVVPINAVTVDAIAHVTVNGNPLPDTGVVPFVHDDGDWRIDKGWACGMAETAQLPTTVCLTHSNPYHPSDRRATAPYRLRTKPVWTVKSLPQDSSEPEDDRPPSTPDQGRVEG